ncbi:carboxypeptidase regulatory-like domain-containing protein, partial [bacterium]|nr:carboxypeptidase regulatory-like domain-containing protein [bacterium]
LDDVPDVIQNSWGVNGDFVVYVDCFDDWNAVILNCEAAGPVITWSAGNEGPDASSLRAPAIYSINEYQIFSVGAVNSTDYSAPYPIASFSSRGPTQCTPYSPDNIKPEISAPGVNIYSSVPGGSYEGDWSGTSMAGPHVAGVVALMREACPDCDYITIKEAIISTATDYGTTGNDNTYGYGFINAYDAVLAVSNLGRIGGIVDDGSNPLAGVQAKITSGSNKVFTNASGQYYMPLPAGTYDVEYTKFGYFSQTIYGINVTVGDTTVQNVSLALAPQGTLSGIVTSCYGGPAVGATVEIVGAPVTPATTDGTGFYSFTIPQGTYDVRASGAGCGEQSVSGVVVTSAATQNFTLPSDPRYECSAPDGGGYIACENGDNGGPIYTWYEISPSAGGSGTHLSITGDDAGASVAIPFNFRLYGTDYTSVWVCSNGFASFSGTSTAYENASLSGSSIGTAIAALWDDLNPLSTQRISYYHLAAENAFIIEWYEMPYWRENGSTATFQIWLYDVATNPGPNGDSQIRIQYQNLDLAGSETVGVTNGSTANQYTFNGSDDANAQGLENSRVITYGGEAAEYGTLQGVITDATTLLPLEGVLVSRVGSAQSTTTNSSGFYSMNAAPGTYDFEFTLDEYFPVTLEDVLIEDGVTVVENIVMHAIPIIVSFSEDFESGAAGWTHAASGGWTDNWHLSTEDANSGTASYKCGDTGTGDYDNLCDALLTSPVVSNLPEDAWLTFVTRIESEISGLYPDSAYDGGTVELSVNSGAFAPIDLIEDYTNTFRYCANSSCSSPYSGPTPGVSCLAGQAPAWQAYTIDLAVYAGDDIQIRFRFGSDGSATDEGWYVDDVSIKSYGGSAIAPTDLTIFADAVNDNLVFHWTATGAAEYQLYSSTNPDGPFNTFVGSTGTDTITIPYPVDDMLYYVVVASN